MQNVLTKYVQPAWAAAAAREAAANGGATTRVRCHWQQTAVATGRLSCTVPNLQVLARCSRFFTLHGFSTPTLLKYTAALIRPAALTAVLCQHAVQSPRAAAAFRP